jgi:hypothetical protein
VKVKPGLVVLNEFVAPRFTADDLTHELPAELAEVVHRHAARAQSSAHFRTRLQGLGLPLVTVPRLFPATFGRAAIEAVAAHFAGEPSR